MQQEKQRPYEDEPIIPTPKYALEYIDELKNRLDLDGLKQFAVIVNDVFGDYLPDEERRMLDKKVVHAVWSVIFARSQLRKKQKFSIKDRDWVVFEGGKSKKRRKG